jgi:TetR/AcrR family transcriptional regulator, lmrAB and yxaGH operons repressor
VGDTRERMIEGGRELIGRNGFRATSFRDIWEFTGTPRGSVYFHFPGGKDELALEVVARQSAIWLALVEKTADRATTPTEFLAGMATGLGIAMERSNYTLGCAISAMAVESPALAEPIRLAVGEFYGTWADAVAAHLRRHGMDADHADRLGGTVITHLVGALAVAKARQDCSSFDQAEAAFEGLAASSSLHGAHR